MASVITPTASTFSTVITPASFATATTPGAKTTLDLRGNKGAWITTQIGRNAATALTRVARINIRRTQNATIRGDDLYDHVSLIAAVNATTVSSGGAAAAATMVLASGTGMAADLWLCANLTGSRIEFFRICNLTTATVTIDQPDGFLVTHNASDVVTNGAEVRTIWIPGNDIYHIWPVNNSGQTLIMGCYAATEVSDTAT